MELLKQANKLDPNNPNIYELLSLAFTLAGQAEAGEQFFSAELAKHIWPCLLLARAQCRLTLEKFDEALVDINDFLSAKPDKKVIHALFYRLCIWLRRDDRVAASKDAHTILSLPAQDAIDLQYQNLAREAIEKLQSSQPRTMFIIPLSMN